MFSIWTLADTSVCKYHLVFYLFRAHLHLLYRFVPFPPIPSKNNTSDWTRFFKTKLFEICTIIYIFTTSYIVVNLWYPNLNFDKTYLPKGYLVLVIPGVVSIDQVHYQNPQLYSTGIMVWIPWKWKLRRLKIEKWGLVIHIIAGLPTELHTHGIWSSVRT